MGTKAQDCRCGNRNVAWGSDRIENVSFLHCVKCSRYVEAETLIEAIEKWNAPAKIAEIGTAVDDGRNDLGIY